MRPSERPIQFRLHQAHFLRPLVERLQGFQQLVGILGDAEEPLRQLALLHKRAGTPAASVDDLLVGEHGVVRPGSQLTFEDLR